ncbi:MAG: SdrD B-like domain-containing protein [Verrucomicrobiales bacterium]
MTDPTVTDLGSNIYCLEYTATVSSETTISSGNQWVLNLATDAIAFDVLYDSATYRSRIDIGTTTVIEVTELAIYDAPYPGGSLVADSTNGQTLYVRATVTDPFGHADITGLDLTISDPVAGDIVIDPGDLTVVYASGDTKIYEYVWNTGANQGVYTLTGTATEGLEASPVTHTAASQITLSQLDLGTPGSVQFTDASGNLVDTYPSGTTTIYVKVTDLDQASTTDPMTTTVTTSDGQTVTVTLTETSPGSGVFTGSQTVTALPAGTTLSASYTDPNDGTDVSTDGAVVPTGASGTPSMAVSKTLVSDATTVVGGTVEYQITVSNTSDVALTGVTVTDTPPTELTYDSASVTPVSTSPLTWNIGALGAYQSTSINVFFTANAVPSSNPVTNTASADSDQTSPAVTDTANVNILNSGLTVTKAVNGGSTYFVGDTVTFDIVVKNTGTTTIVSPLPLSDNYSTSLQFVSATPSPDGAGGGTLFFADILSGGSLAPNGEITITTTYTVTGAADPATNTAAVNFAKDNLGNDVPKASDSDSVTTLAGSIGDIVWLDADGDGAKDAGEDGISGVLVWLDLDNDGERDPNEPFDITDASGAYEIINLAPGSYTVRVDETTLPDGVSQTGDPDAALDNAATATITKDVGGGTITNFTDADFGYQGGTASISGTVYNDDGGTPNAFDGTDSPVGGVIIELWYDLDGDGDLTTGSPTMIETTVTDSNGDYSFTNLGGGTYVVVEQDPLGATSVTDKEGDTTNPDYNQIPVLLADGIANTGNDFLDGGVTSGTISGSIYNDTGADGSGSGDALLTESIVISLWTDPNNDGDPSDGVKIGEVTTTDGTYTFSNVTPGNYVVVETDPTGYGSTGDSDGIATGYNAIDVQLTSGETDTGNDFYDTASVNLASVSGSIYVDTVDDGAIGSGDTPIGGETVSIYLDNGSAAGDLDGSDTLIATTTTATDGSYSFGDLPPGDYIIVHGGGGSNELDVDGAANGSDNIAVTVSAGDAETAQDFLMPTSTSTGTITGVVYNDDGSTGGAIDGTDTAIPGVTVKLYSDPNGDGDPSDGVLIATTVTTLDGSYLFDNLGDGDYVVQEINPAGATSVTDADEPNANSDDQIGVTLTSGTPDIASADFLDTGATLAGISGTVFADGGNGAFGVDDTAIGGSGIMLYTDPNGDGDPSDGTLFGGFFPGSDGKFNFPNLPSGNYVIVETNPAGYLSITDIDAVNDDTIKVTLSGTDVTGRDFLNQFIVPGTITGQVRNDSNGDGNLADADSGVTGVVIELWADTDGNGTPDTKVATTVTDADGNYTFSNVTPGDYVVVEIDPNGATSTNDKDDDALNSAGTDNQIALTLSNGGTSSGNDFLDTGITEASISGTVLNDTNGDGNLADPDAGVPGVTVELYSDPNGDGDPSDGTLIASTVTDLNGGYSFTGLAAGNYAVVETDPSGATSTNDADDDALNAVGTDNQVSVALGATDSTSNDFLDTGLTLYTIGGQVTDLGTGAPIPGVTVTLRDSGGNVIGTATTDGSGNYAFANLPAGDYTVTETDPSGTTSGTDKDSADNDNVIAITGLSGDSLDNDFADGGVTLVAVSGQVRNDTNGDGSLLDSDGGISGVTVALWSDPNGDGDPSDGTLLGTTTTGPDGSYSFGGLPLGDYVVVETDPSGFTSTNDADGAGNTVNMVAADATSGDSTGNDFLDSAPGSISGTVWNDTGDDNVIGAGDTGLTGVTVELWADTDGNGTPDSLVASTTTDADGNYSFTGVAPGDYVVVETDPAGATSVTDTEGAATDNQVALTLAPNQDSTGNDFLDEIAGSSLFDLAGTVRLDADGDGSIGGGETGTIGGATLGLYSDPNGDGDPSDGTLLDTTTSGPGGGYVFHDLPNGDYVVVEIDADGYASTGDADGGDANTLAAEINSADSTGNDFYDAPAGSIAGTVYEDGGNGAFGADDAPLAGVTVELWEDTDGNGTPDVLVASTTTDGNGDYSFGGLLPAAYIVVETDPAGATSLDDTDSSDVATQQDNLVAVTLAAGEDSTGNDFLDEAGSALYAISGKVVDDLDGDGVQDGGETGGLSGATIELWSDPNGDGDPSDGTLIATATTGPDGSYSFGNLSAGDYVVLETDPSSVASTGDSDGGDANSIAVELTSADSTGNDFLDAPTGSIAGTVYADDTTAGFSGGDTALAGVTVELWEDTDGDGNPDTLVASTTTSSGGYLFTGIPAGDYTIYEVDPLGATSVDDRSTDGNEGAATDNSISLTLASGQDSAGNDFLDDTTAVTLHDISGQVRVDADGDGDLGDADSGLSGIRVELWSDPNGDGDPSDGTLLAVGSTDASGNYTFSGYPDGDYVVVETDRDGYNSTGDADGTADNTSSEVAVTLAGTDSTGNDFIDALDGSIAGTVYDDDTTAGFSSGDVPQPGVTVQLWQDSDGDGSLDTLVAETTTGSSGGYLFDGLPAGDYTVVEIDPTGATSIDDTEGAATDNQVALTLAAGGSSTGNDFLDSNTLLADIAGTVYNDLNGDGDSEGGADPTLDGVTVQLWSDPNGDGDPSDGVLIETTTTSGGGAYLFADVPAGDYVVVETDLSGYASTNDADGTADNTANQIAVAHDATADSIGNDFLDAQSASIAGTVYDDEGTAGFGGGDIPMGGVTVKLWADTTGDGILDTLVATTTTAGDGTYSFDDVAPGSYTIVEKDPTGATSVDDTEGAATDNAIAVTVAPGESSTGNDFLDDGASLHLIAGRIVNDQNSNGVDDSEPLLTQPTTVTLYTDPNGDGDPSDGVVVATTTTTDGTYSFGGLADGNYVVVEGDAESYVSTNDVDGGNNGRNLIQVALAGADSTGNDFLDSVDPQGYFYSVSNGQIIPGGSISVVGPGGVTIDLDGSSGEYSWYIDGTPGIYTMIVTAPAGWEIDPATPPSGSTLDPTGQGSPYSLGNAASGGFLTGYSSPTTWYATFDLAAGDPLIIHNNIPLASTKPDTFDEFTTTYGVTGGAGNPDGDLDDNLAEYALCTDPTTGIADGAPFCVEPNGATGELEAFFKRTAGGLTDVTYTLEARDTLAGNGDDSAEWFDVTQLNDDTDSHVTITVSADGTEEVRFIDLEDIDMPNSAGKLGTEGYVRVRMDGSGDLAGETSYTRTFGWFEQTIATQCESSSDPFLKKESFSGVVDSVNVGASTLNVATAVGTGDLLAAIASGKQYYIEVVAGDHVGHRFELDEAATLGGDGKTLHISTDVSGPSSEGNYNTAALSSLTDLAADTIVVREHRTLEDAFPLDLYNETTSHSTADRILFLNHAAGYDVYWDYDGTLDLPTAGVERWLLRGDSSGVGQGQVKVIRPCEGFFVHPRAGSVTRRSVGIVRENALRCPLKTGWNFIANPWTVDRHAAPDQAGILPDNTPTVNDLGLTRGNGFTGTASRGTADQIQTWLADEPANTGIEGYGGYYLLNADFSAFGLGMRDHWTKIGETGLEDDNTVSVLKSGRSFFLRMQNPVDDWVILVP